MPEAESILESVTASVKENKPAPRTLIVIAHPDDEVVALGARLPRHKDSVFIHVTDGAPLDGADASLHGFSSVERYREARMKELQHAFQLAGIPNAVRLHLEIADQRASMYLDYLSAFLQQVIAESGAEAILTHPYEGGHPDHDACAFAVHSAVRRAMPATRPVIIEAAFYHAGPHGIETNRFLPGVRATVEVNRCLTPAERSAKQALLDCFSTQHNTLKLFDLNAERYRIAPVYDFTRPPHEGKLFYEQFPWGMTGERFRRFAALASTAGSPLWR